MNLDGCMDLCQAKSEAVYLSIQVKLGIEASQKRLHKCLTTLEELQKDTPNQVLKYAAIYISAQLDLCSWHLQHLPAR